jgi:hypothetical protein
LIVDCWYGWIDEGFRAWVRENYDWIRLVYVPAACTPKAQPMDAGIIAKIKAIMRKFYGTWVCELTQDQINNGIEPSLIKVPNDVPTCKLNLFEWLSKTVEQLNIDPACVAHCWESTLLLSAWEHKVQVEASKKAAELFPNLAGADPPSEEDRDAGYMGMPFVNGTDEEWMSWVMEWVRDDASLQRFAPHDASIAP